MLTIIIRLLAKSLSADNYLVFGDSMNDGNKEFYKNKHE